MTHTARLLSAFTFALFAGCDDVEPSVDGLSGELYNPCGPDVDREDCPGGKPAGEQGSGTLAHVTGSRGTHTLEVYTLGCSIELDSVGTPSDLGMCPDCSLTLEMSHASLDDGCGVGPVNYGSVVGLMPRGGGDYAVYLSLDGVDWYAIGDGTVEGQVLSYAAVSVYDVAYSGYYGGTPAYGFTGDHTFH